MSGIGFKCPECGCTACDVCREWNGILQAGNPGKIIGYKCQGCHKLFEVFPSDQEEKSFGSEEIRQ